MLEVVLQGDLAGRLLNVFLGDGRRHGLDVQNLAINGQDVQFVLHGQFRDITTHIKHHARRAVRKGENETLIESRNHIVVRLGAVLRVTVLVHENATKQPPSPWNRIVAMRSCSSGES